MCPHSPSCPDARALDREAARTVVSHPEQGWSLLCNGIVVFEDTGELLPGGDTVPPHRPTDVSANSGIVPAAWRRAAQVAAPAEPAAAEPAA
jgi:Family of unknown function (DUF5999)